MKKLEPLAKGGKKPPPLSEQRAAETHKGHYLDLTISYLVSVPNLHLLLAQNGKKRLLLYRPTNEFPNPKSVRKGHNNMQLESAYNCKERRMEWTSAMHWVHPPWINPTPIPTSSAHHLISEIISCAVCLTHVSKYFAVQCTVI